MDKYKQNTSNNSNFNNFIITDKINITNNYYKYSTATPEKKDKLSSYDENLKDSIELYDFALNLELLKFKVNKMNRMADKLKVITEQSVEESPYKSNLNINFCNSNNKTDYSIKKPDFNSSKINTPTPICKDNVNNFSINSSTNNNKQFDIITTSLNIIPEDRENREINSDKDKTDIDCNENINNDYPSRPSTCVANKDDSTASVKEESFLEIYRRKKIQKTVVTKLTKAPILSLMNQKENTDLNKETIVNAKSSTAYPDKNHAKNISSRYINYNTSFNLDELVNNIVNLNKTDEGSVFSQSNLSTVNNKTAEKDISLNFNDLKIARIKHYKTNSFSSKDFKSIVKLDKKVDFSFSSNLTPRKKVTFAEKETTFNLDEIRPKRKINLNSTPTRTILKGKHADDNDFSLLNLLGVNNLKPEKELNISDYDFDIYESDDETCKKIAMQKLNFLIDEQDKVVPKGDENEIVPIPVKKKLEPKTSSANLNKRYQATPPKKSYNKSICKKFTQNPAKFYTEPLCDLDMKELKNTINESNMLSTKTGIQTPIVNDKNNSKINEKKPSKIIKIQKNLNKSSTSK
jgi:hypothetical protein